MVCGVKSIEGLLAESDVIVVGRIASVGPTIDDSVVELLLDPSDVVLGPVRPGLLSMIYPTSGFDGAAEYVRAELEGQRVLVFLRRDTDSGPMIPLPSMNCSSPIGRPAEDFFVYPKVYEEILLPPTSNDNSTQRLIKQLVALTGQAESEFAVRAGGYLVELARNPGESLLTLRAAYRALMQSGNPSSYTVGLSGLVTIGDFVGLEALDVAIRSDRNINRDDLFQRMQSRFPDPDPRVVALLERWLDPAIPTDQRIASSRTLLRLQTATAIVALSRALYDSELEVRWAAVRGLIPFANFGRTGRESPEKDWPFPTRETHLNSISTPSLYVDEEATYLGFWKSWWEDNQDAVRALAAQEATP